MKIAVSVDNHFDVNRVDGLAMIPAQVDYLQRNGYAAYINAGDTYNDFQKTLTYYQALQRAAGPDLTVRFLAGNHDLVNGITYEESQSPIDPLYLHEQQLVIGNSAIIGNNGWYDYSLAPEDLNKTVKDFQLWKKGYWIDSGIPQPVSDEERMRRVLIRTESALIEAHKQSKKAIYITHFVPRSDFIPYRPDRPRWQMATALLGSKHLGHLLERYRVPTVVFGHVHTRHQPTKFGFTTYYHQPVGYGINRLFEWESHDWLTEWQTTLVTLTV